MRNDLIMYTNKEICRKIIMEYTDKEKGISVNELSTKINEMGFKISIASLYNYISCYIRMGIVKKKGTKYFYIGEKLFDHNEARLVACAIISLNILTEEKTKQLLYKFSKISGEDAFKCIFERFEDYYKFWRCKKAKDEEAFRTLSTILSAKSNNNKIKFKYYNKDEKPDFMTDKEGKHKKIYKINPHCLFWQNDMYYLLGYTDDYNKIMHIRIDRIVDCEELDDKIMNIN